MSRVLFILKRRPDYNLMWFPPDENKQPQTVSVAPTATEITDDIPF